MKQSPLALGNFLRELDRRPEVPVLTDDDSDVISLFISEMNQVDREADVDALLLLFQNLCQKAPSAPCRELGTPV